MNKKRTKKDDIQFDIFLKIAGFQRDMLMTDAALLYFLHI